jgi:hypothetical protein
MTENDAEKINRLTAAMKDGFLHPPMVGPDRDWRSGVMAEIRSLAEVGPYKTDLFCIPRGLFRVVPLMAAASLIFFIGAWSAMGTLFNDLAISVLTELPFFGL